MANGSNGGDAPRKRAGDPLGAHSEIGRKLKQYFDGLVSDDVPDRFAQLLTQLERTEPTESGSPAKTQGSGKAQGSAKAQGLARGQE